MTYHTAITYHTTHQPDRLHPSVFLASGSTVIGDVTIGEDSSVWFGAVLRGDSERIEIGRRTNIQDGCILHADPGFPCIIGDGVTLGHGAIVHGATVETNVVVGMRAVVLNGARIGANSIVGAGAVVVEGMHIPPDSLVLGLPAKIVRTLSVEQIQRAAEAAERYVERARAYRAARARQDLSIDQK